MEDQIITKLKAVRQLQIQLCQDIIECPTGKGLKRELEAELEATERTLDAANYLFSNFKKLK